MPATLAERLGFSVDDRVAIVHADDIGMCHAANEGAFEALTGGPASCGSIMVPCPWFHESAQVAAQHPEFDLGVHLTLNSEFEHYRWGPVAGRAAVPSLLDEDGYLWRTSLEVAQNAKPEEVEQELRAQIDMALRAGVDVTHLDAHMGTVFFPPFPAVYRKLAADYRVPVFVARPADEDLAQAGIPGAGDLLRGMADALDAQGFPVLDGFDANSLACPEGEGLAHNRARLEGLRPGVSYLICHPAQAGEELSAITPDSAYQRDYERLFYGGAVGREEFGAAGVKTVGMRELRKLLRGS